MKRRLEADHRWRRTRLGVLAMLLAATVIAGGAALEGPAGASPTPATTSYDPSTDPYAMASVTDAIGASAFWRSGYTGQGIDVAVIDSGVAPVPGLDAAGKVIQGPDLSLESQASNLTRLDTYGHGTFMAGLIAGHASDLQEPYWTAPATQYRGVAPDARILSLKVATADGGVDVTQMVAAIDWVVQHKDDNGMHVRILNLSYGTNSTQSAAVDPLSYAVEQAWREGIVVVAAAGNTGFQRGSNAPGLADPAYNPYVIGVGGFDNGGTSPVKDDSMGTYSASSAGCSGCKKPDFVAVGSHVQGLRVPGSWIDQQHPDGRLGTQYFRGSGTSEAAAVTSGSIALLLQKYPSLTPDQVKAFITRYSAKVPGASAESQGAGEIDLKALVKQPPAAASQAFSPAAGTGSIEIARGTDHLTANGVTLSGEQDIFGEPVDTSALASAESTIASWSGGTWNGNVWSGSSWSGSMWIGATWRGISWSGASWSSSTWSGNSWSGNSWSGNSWSGNSWSGNTWSGNTWSGGSWS